MPKNDYSSPLGHRPNRPQSCLSREARCVVGQDWERQAKASPRLSPERYQTGTGPGSPPRKLHEKAMAWGGRLFRLRLFLGILRPRLQKRTPRPLSAVLAAETCQNPGQRIFFKIFLFPKLDVRLEGRSPATNLSKGRREPTLLLLPPARSPLDCRANGSVLETRVKLTSSPGARRHGEPKDPNRARAASVGHHRFLSRSGEPAVTERTKPAPDRRGASPLEKTRRRSSNDTSSSPRDPAYPYLARLPRRYNAGHGLRELRYAHGRSSDRSQAETLVKANPPAFVRLFNPEASELLPSRPHRQRIVLPFKKTPDSTDVVAGIQRSSELPSFVPACLTSRSLVSPLPRVHEAETCGGCSSVVRLSLLDKDGKLTKTSHPKSLARKARPPGDSTEAPLRQESF